MYIILGADKKEYGPVDLETLRKWVAEGRINSSTMTMPEGGTEWAALSSLPEFAAAVARPPGLLPPGAPPAPVPARTSVLAIASLVLGVLGLFSCGVTSLFGLILGIIALVKINHSNGMLGGKGLAIGGLCTSGAFVLLIPLMAAIAIPNFVKARESAQQKACINNLLQIDGAKEQWALENKKTTEDTPTLNDLVGKYLRTMPVCPLNGTYTLGNMSKKPTCSVPGHTLE